MVKITIEHFETQTYTEMQNFCIKRTPTEITEESDYGGRAKKVQYIEENQPQEVTKSRDVRTTLVQQEIRDDAEFDIKAVIKAINKL